MPLATGTIIALVVGSVVVLTGVTLIATKDLYIYNTCTCANGVFGIKDTCPVDEAEFCLSCDDGYYLSEALITNNTCLENECQCHNGVGETNANCPSHQDFKCDTCDDGYFFNDFTCPLKECTCNNGNGTSRPWAQLAY